MNWRKGTRSISNGACVEVGSWRKSAHSMGNGNCVEIGGWRKALASLTSACVEVGSGQAVVGVRDTMQAGQEDRTVLEFPTAAWERFLAGLRG